MEKDLNNNSEIKEKSSEEIRDMILEEMEKENELTEEDAQRIKDYLGQEDIADKLKKSFEEDGTNVVEVGENDNIEIGIGKDGKPLIKKIRKKAPDHVEVVSFETALQRLITKNPYLVYLNAIIYKRSVRDFKTMGVGVEKGQYVMLYDPEFVNKYDSQYIETVIHHEFLHIAFNHLSYYRKKTHRYLANIAYDAVINECLKEHFETAKKYDSGIQDVIFFETIDKQLKTKFSENRNQSGDYYYSEMYKAIPDEDKKGQGKGGGQRGMLGEKVDKLNEKTSHEQWKNFDDLSEVEKAKVEASLKKGTDEAKTRGNMPMKIEMALEMSKEQPKIQWKKVLRHFLHLTKTQGRTRRSTRKQSNKKIEDLPKIISKKNLPIIAVAIDESGSVGNEFLQIVFRELNKFATYFDFYVIPFDAEVHEHQCFLWKRNQKLELKRVACGGTDFQKVMDYMSSDRKMKTKVKGVIFITDLEDDIPQKDKTKRIWITHKENSITEEFEKNDEIVIEIDVDEENNE